MQFKPNFDLLCCWKDAKKSKDFVCNSAYVAIFKRDNKTLVYMCDAHWLNISFNMVDMCFADDFGIKPDVLIAEMENAGFEWKLGWSGYQNNTLAYAVAVATKKMIPVVLADLSDEQMMQVLRVGFPDKEITKDVLHQTLRAGPNKDEMCEYLNKYGRDRFMLENIATALNKYDTVFAIFGGGHYEVQRLVLEDMMGKPEYITRIKNTRGDFSDVKIKPVTLCEFDIKN